MSPLRKKKRTGRHNVSLLNRKTGWLIFGAALTCIVVIIVFSLSSSGDFKDISYIPRGDGTLFDNPPGDGAAGDSGTGTDGAGAPSLPDLTSLPEEYRQLAARHLSPEQKQDFIRNKYTYLFNSLNDYYNWELKRLLQAAKNDYLAVKNGRKDISMAQLAGEYLRAGRSLEKEADHNFSDLLGQMKSELKNSDLPLDLAKEAEQEYKDQKSLMRKELLGLLGSYIND